MGMTLCEACTLKRNSKTVNTLLLDVYKAINDYELKNNTLIMDGDFEYLFDDIEVYLEDEGMIE